MIYYNMRYRGAYEYDKFTLNILNYSNYVNEYIYDINNTSIEQDTFKNKEVQIDEAFDTMLLNMETIYRDFILNR